MVQNLSSRRSISVFSKNGVCSTCWRIFLENKTILGGGGDFQYEVLVPTDRRLEVVCFYHVLYILVAAVTIECKVSENISLTKEE